MHEYSINEITKITGLSRTTLLYYESKGLITPKQSSENGYRKYSQSEASQIMFYQSLKPLGISVEEYAGIVNKTSSTYTDTYDLILRKKAEYMKRLTVYVSMWEDTLVIMHTLQKEGIYYQIKESLDAWALPTPSRSNSDHQEVLKNWNQYFFQRNISYFFDQQKVENHDYHFEAGLTCYADSTFTLPEHVRSTLTYIPSTTCLLLIMPFNMNEDNFDPLFRKAASILTHENLMISGNPWGNVGYRGELEDKITDFFFLWIPVTR